MDVDFSFDRTRRAELVEHPKHFTNIGSGAKNLIEQLLISNDKFQPFANYKIDSQIRKRKQKATE